MTENQFEEERLGQLLGLVREPPADWVAAAKERPRLERGVTQILALAEADVRIRDALIADIESGIEKAGLESDPLLVRELRERLATGNAETDS